MIWLLTKGMDTSRNEFMKFLVYLSSPIIKTLRTKKEPSMNTDGKTCTHRIVYKWLHGSDIKFEVMLGYGCTSIKTLFKFYRGSQFYW
jgi:hypothetical protein